MIERRLPWLRPERWGVTIWCHLVRRQGIAVFICIISKIVGCKRRIGSYGFRGLYSQRVPSKSHGILDKRAGIPGPPEEETGSSTCKKEEFSFIFCQGGLFSSLQPRTA
jgi:hypothetical protein